MAEAPHALYLPPATHSAASEPTRRALEYVEGAAPALQKQLNVTVEVYALRPKDAANPRVATAFRRRGISSLPALLAGGRAYVGCHEIKDYYSRRLGPGRPGNPAPHHRAGPVQQEWGGDPEDFANTSAEEELDSFMRNEIGGGGRLGSNIDFSELGYGGDD
jgi:hypothetical protein